MAYMVSYTIGGQSGNQTAPDLDDLRQFISENKGKWRSYTIFSYNPDQPNSQTGFVLTLIPIL